MAPRKLKAVPESGITDDDLLPESRPEELPPETGTAVRKAIPVRYTVVREGEGGTVETDRGPMRYDPGDILLHEGDRVWPVDTSWFNRHYRVVQGEDTESAYDDQFPKFTTGGTGYARVICPDCDQTMIFSVEIGEIRTSGDKSTLKPTFKVKPKEHFCDQVSAKLEDLEPVIASTEDADDDGDD
jgi:hypothetical protein